MKIYFTLDENNRLTGWQSNPSHVEGEIELEVDDDHEVLQRPMIYKYIDGELVKDEEYLEELKEEYEQERSKPTELERLEALENAMLELILRGDIID